MSPPIDKNGTDHSGSQVSAKGYARQRLKFLEAEYRRQLLSFDLLCEASEMHGYSSGRAQADEALRVVYRCLSPLLDIISCGLLMVDDKAAFTLRAVRPAGSVDLQREVDALITDGDFSWSIKQSGPQIRQSFCGGNTILLNALSAGNRVRGMFVAVLRGQQQLENYIEKTIVIALNYCAFAVENASLHSALAAQQHEFERRDRKQARELASRAQSREQRQRSDKHQALEVELEQALKHGQLFVCYQPKIDLLSEEIVGAEALLRWRHPERGMISPDEFIPVAEDCHLIEPIGEWVLRRVCAQLKHWEQQGKATGKCSVNLSQVQLQQRDLAQLFASILSDAGVASEQLEFELTETSLTRDVEAASDVLGELHAMGFGLSIDDFGTGHSSLTLLKKFPLDAIKVDRSFIRDLSSDPDDAAIVNAVVTMGHNLRMRVVAEGVETREQLHFLRSMGCHEVQGYYVGRPMLAGDYEKLCSDWRGLSAN